MSKPLKILFITPFWQGRELSQRFPPLGAVLLGTILTQRGHEVEIFDPVVEDENSLGPYLESKKNYFDIVCLSTCSYSKKQDIEAIDLAVKNNSNALVLVGGYYATLEPEECVRITEADILVKGEGELPILEIIERIAGKKKSEKFNRQEAIAIAGKFALKGLHQPKGKKDRKSQKRYDAFAKKAGKIQPVPGLFVRFVDKNTEHYIKTGEHERLTQEKFDELYDQITRGGLNFDIVNLDKYRPIEDIKSYQVVIPFRRGCLYQCIFCTAPTCFKTKELIGCSIEGYVGLLEATLRRYPKIKNVAFGDESITLYRKDAVELCTELAKAIKNGRIPAVSFSAFANVVTLVKKTVGGYAAEPIDVELLKMFGAANVDVLAFGFESGSDKVLKDLRKPHRRKDIDMLIENLEKVKQHVKAQAYFILGGSYESTFDDLLETLELIAECYKKLGETCGLDIIQYITPHKGLKIYEDLKIIEDRIRMARKRAEKPTWDRQIAIVEHQIKGRVIEEAIHFRIKDSRVDFFIEKYTEKARRSGTITTEIHMGEEGDKNAVIISDLYNSMADVLNNGPAVDKVTRIKAMHVLGKLQEAIRENHTNRLLRWLTKGR